MSQSKEETAKWAFGKKGEGQEPSGQSRKADHYLAKAGPPKSFVDPTAQTHARLTQKNPPLNVIPPRV